MRHKFLPCPFCGSNAADIHYTIPVVWCVSCKAKGPYPSTTGDEREAVALWNQRLDSERDE